MKAEDLAERQGQDTLANASSGEWGLAFIVIEPYICSCLSETLGFNSESAGMTSQPF